MAIKGLSKLVLADYLEDGQTVTYANPVNNEKLASYSADFESSDDNNLYLDNEVAESDAGTFQSGNITIETGNLSNETSKKLYTVKEKEITVGDKKIKEFIYDDDIKIKDLGVGIIEWHQVNGEDLYRAIWFTRVRFNIDSNSATTKGQQIDWQTKTIEGNIMRSAEMSNDYKRPWKKQADFETEADALAYLLLKGGKAA